MKLTNNRKLILRLLNENIDDCGGLPPYSASSLHWALHNNGFAKWYAEQDGTEPPKGKPPSIQQIHRTLKDLANEGLIVCEYRIDNDTLNPLPQKIAYWQLTERVEYNAMVKACADLHNKTERAKFGVNIFGGSLGKGLPPSDVVKLKADIKALMQKTHPARPPDLPNNSNSCKSVCNGFVRVLMHPTAGPEHTGLKHSALPAHNP